MQTALQLRWRHVDPSDAVAEQVRAEVERLERFSDRITGCAVTLEAPSGHHRHGGAQYRVRIELSVPPRGKIVVGRAPPKAWTRSDLYLAVKEAFREAQRQLSDHVRRVDARVKAHEAPAVATVARLLPDDGYGFLRTADGREVYFHERSVLRGGFSRLRLGTEVRFAEEAGDDGPQASTVQPLRPPRGRPAGAGAGLDALPRPARETPLHGILERRRSIREFARRDLAPRELAALLWAGQGITSKEGGRAAPSAGGLYPLTVSLLDARGVWRYVPEDHALALVEAQDRRVQLAAAATGQEFLAEAPVTLAVTASPAVLAGRYRERAERYCLLEAGHVAQNVLLMATALGLAAAPVAAFDDEAVLAALGLGEGHLPLYLLPVGAPP